jgi:enolase
LREQGHEGTLVGDEGGYGPKLTSNSRAAELIVEAIERAGLEPGKQVALGLDVAATHFAGEGDSPEYCLAHSPGLESCRSSALVDLFADWVEKYPIVSIEDPLSELDRTGWREITKRLGNRVQLIGDDLFVTNAARLKQGIAEGLANSVLIKVNQIGTLSETFATLRLALEAGYWPVISARSGETEDATIADLAVATGAGQIKIGSVARSERLAKYNQLLRLEERLGNRATYLGGAIFSSLKPAPSLRP